jgi:hypothetical protein
VCGSACAGSDVITGIDYAFDTAKTYSRSLRSLDSAYDGPCESFLDSISVQALSGGQHKMYVQAHTASGAVSIDSLSFSVSKAGAFQRPGGAEVANASNIGEIRTHNRIKLTVPSALATAAGGLMTARVVSLSGACVKNLTCTGKGGYFFEWVGERSINAKAAPGVYFIVVSLKGEVIYRTMMIVGR